MNIFNFFINYLKNPKRMHGYEAIKKWRGTEKFDTFNVGQYGSKNCIFFGVTEWKSFGLSFKNRSLTMFQVFLCC